jgi:hypothetical protein
MIILQYLLIYSPTSFALHFISFLFLIFIMALDQELGILLWQHFIIGNVELIIRDIFETVECHQHQQSKELTTKTNIMEILFVTSKGLP